MNKSKLRGIIQLKKRGSQRRKNQEWCSRFHGSKPCGLCYFDRVLPPAFFLRPTFFLDIPFLRVVISTIHHILKMISLIFQNTHGKNRLKLSLILLFNQEKFLFSFIQLVAKSTRFRWLIRRHSAFPTFETFTSHCFSKSLPICSKSSSR